MSANVTASANVRHTTINDPRTANFDVLMMTSAATPLLGGAAGSVVGLMVGGKSLTGMLVGGGIGLAVGGSMSAVSALAAASVAPKSVPQFSVPGYVAGAIGGGLGVVGTISGAEALTRKVPVLMSTGWGRAGMVVGGIAVVMAPVAGVSALAASIFGGATPSKVHASHHGTAHNAPV